MLFHGVPLDCINQAAVAYHVPASVIVSVIQAENGRNGDAIKNKNGTYDLGLMQINTKWLATLKSKGITREDIQYDPCTNVQVGTWILAQGVARSSGWQGVGNFHSTTPKYNKMYREKIKTLYSQNNFIVRRSA